MVPDRHPGATDDRWVLAGLRRSWPPAVPHDTRGYRPLDLGGTQPLAALALDDGRAVVVVGHGGDRPPSALPCRRRRDGWSVARAGDGLAAALIAQLGRAVGTEASRFALQRLAAAHLATGPERELGTDQSNISTVVGDTAIVKWRSAPDADGRRATRLRRHLQANDFTHAPTLLASLTWTDDTGEHWVLADVDAYLPDAVDGWDHAIARLQGDVETGVDPPVPDLASTLGTLTAELHAALLRPSTIVPSPARLAVPDEMAAIREAGLQLLVRTLAIEATDQDDVRAREPLLRAALERLPADSTRLGPIHGDLHLGQLVRWRGGLDVIDFDGSPEPMAPLGDQDAPARDVAQMTCSLWSLAAVVNQRTEGAYERRLVDWAARSERTFLETYHGELASVGAETFDERLLEPFVAEQFCRELLYAEATLPRWRYAPLQALRWRYPLRGDDDG